MVKVGMGNKDMINFDQLLDGEIAYPRACVDKNIVIDKHSCRSEISPDSTATPQNFDSHVGLVRSLMSKLLAIDFSPAPTATARSAYAG